MRALAVATVCLITACSGGESGADAGLDGARGIDGSTPIDAQLPRDDAAIDAAPVPPGDSATPEMDAGSTPEDAAIPESDAGSASGDSILSAFASAYCDGATACAARFGSPYRSY